ncbi:MAG: hypothetical protein K9K79_09780 [Desulfohalobiaceae bacterium]|nr:hypothetical protein [Desulfohalobiaceae bacterium]
MIQPRNPVQAFWDWFSDLPVLHRKFLAHLFWVCTGEDTADLIMDPEESLAKFGHYLQRQDFPLRMLSRMVIVRGMVTFILDNRESFENRHLWPGYRQGGNISFLSEAQWNKHLRSWRVLLTKELSDASLSYWARMVTS